MKGKFFTKILGVGLTLALLTSLLLTAAPVSALSAPSVTVDPTTISEEDAVYNIRFELDKQLSGDVTTLDVITSPFDYNLVDSGDSFVITAGAPGTSTITQSKGTVDVTMSGTGSWTGPGAAAQTITFNAIGETATVTVLKGEPLTGECSGTWADVNADATAELGVASTAADTITVVFPAGTIVAEAPVVTLMAGPGWINNLWLPGLNTDAITAEGTADTRTVVISLESGARIGEGADVRLSFTEGITNPDDPDDYNLTVETSREDAKTSADYAIEVPDVGVLPGVVEQYNASGILMATRTGDTAINTLVDSAGDDYTIVVGPGEYAIDATIAITQKGLTLESSDGAEDTVIDASGVGLAITIGPTSGEAAPDVTVDGFTIEADGGNAIWCYYADDAIIQNNIFTFDSLGTGIDVAWLSTGVTVSENELNEHTIIWVHGSDCTVSDNIFGHIIFVDPQDEETLEGVTITDNTFPAPEDDIVGEGLFGDDLGAISLVAYYEATETTIKDILIEGNTLSNRTYGILFWAKGSDYLNVQDVRILDNDITDNEGVGILIDSNVAIDLDSGIAIKFNTITGNDADNDGYGIQNDCATTDVVVDATFNWWGTSVADDVAAMVNDGEDAVTTYEPFLADTYDAVFSASDVAVGKTSIAKDTAGVAVLVTLAGTDPDGEVVNVISVAKYNENPEEAIADFIAFFDVYVAGTFVDVDTKATIKFYAGDANTDVYIWAAGTQTWEEVDADFSAYGGYVYVTIEDPANLAGTPFALVAGVAAEIPAPGILSPEVGDDTVSLRPVFAWETVPEADGYYFQLADNAIFVLPLVKLESDMGRLSGTTYAYVGEKLPYSTPYHWRVKAVSGTEAAGDLAESTWTGGVFITMDEPEEPTPPVVIEPAPPAPAPIIEPIVEVITPAPTEVTPGWIYAIIAVGGVLVIALLVLIVRTRRVA